MKKLWKIFALLLLCQSMTPVFAASKRAKSGADSEEGWIIKKTKNGIIKIPKKQSFRFGDSNIEGSADRPSETVLGTTTPRRDVSLIPLRTSYKKELLEAADYQ